MSNPSETADDQAQCIVDEQWQDTTVIISCAGVIDMLTAPDLERRIASALEKKPNSMIMDLTNVDFLASRGMGVLVVAHEACSPAIKFAVVADGSITSRPMKLVGLTDLLDVYATRDDALNSLREANTGASSLP